MTRLQAIEMIGDRITDLDVRRASLLPDDPNRHTLDDLRTLLDERQRNLSKTVFNDTTPRFQTAAKHLEEINTKVKASIKDLDDVAAALDHVKRFLDGVSLLVAAAGPLL